jgi:hypothetical protein
LAVFTYTVEPSTSTLIGVGVPLPPRTSVNSAESGLGISPPFMAMVVLLPSTFTTMLAVT